MPEEFRCPADGPHEGAWHERLGEHHHLAARIVTHMPRWVGALIGASVPVGLSAAAVGGDAIDVMYADRQTTQIQRDVQQMREKGADAESEAVSFVLSAAAGYWTTAYGADAGPVRVTTFNQPAAAEGSEVLVLVKAEVGASVSYYEAQIAFTDTGRLRFGTMQPLHPEDAKTRLARDLDQRGATSAVSTR